MTDYESSSSLLNPVKRDKCVRFFTGFNTLLLLATLGILIGIGLYLIPNVKNMSDSVQNFSHTIDRINNLVDKVDNIPNIDWEFITNSTEQTRLITVIREVINHWPGIQ